MPIIPSIKTTRISQDEFKALSYEVMRHVFAIHNEFGRLFDEGIYKKELAVRMDGVILEASVALVHRTFVKQLFADVIVSQSGLFEFKATETLHPKHRSQTIQYLLLFDLSHAKLVNMRTEHVQHEFVNCHQRLQELRQFTIDIDHFDLSVAGAVEFHDHLVGLLCDWGTGLSLSLYEEAMLHFLAGVEPEDSSVSVIGSRGALGRQPMRLAAPSVAFKLSALTDREEAFQVHGQRLVEHTSLDAIHWANIRNGRVTFRTIH